MAMMKILYKSVYWKVFQFLTSFIVNIVFVRVFRSSISAEFYSLIYLFSLAVTFFSFGMDIGLNFYLTKRQISQTMANRIIILALIVALSVSLSLIRLYVQPSGYPDWTSGYLLLFSGLYIAGGLLTALSGAIFTAHNQNHIPSQTAFVLNCVLITVVTAANSLVSRHSLIPTLFIVYFLCSFVQGFFLFLYSWWIYTRADAKPMLTGIPLRQILQFSFTAFVINFIFYAGSRLSLYLIPYWMLPADRGNYIQAFKLVEYVGLLAAFVYYPFMNLAAGEDTKKIDSIVLFLVRLSNSLVLVFGIFMAACGWWLFPFIFGSSFDRVYPIFLWFIPGLFAVCSSTFFTAYYFGRGKLKYNFVSACILMASMGAFYFPLMKWWGGAGAAIAFSLATLLSLLYDIGRFGKQVNYRVSDILFVRKTDLADIGMFFKKNRYH
jgi:O-antigen/teichoic acid export membrane protein